MIGTLEYLHDGTSMTIPDLDYETVEDAPLLAAVHWPDLLVPGEFEPVETDPAQRTMMGRWESIWSDDVLILWRDPTLVEIFAGLTGQAVPE